MRLGNRFPGTKCSAGNGCPELHQSYFLVPSGVCGWPFNCKGQEFCVRVRARVRHRTARYHPEVFSDPSRRPPTSLCHRPTSSYVDCEPRGTSPRTSTSPSSSSLVLLLALIVIAAASSHCDYGSRPHFPTRGCQPEGGQRDGAKDRQLLAAVPRVTEGAHVDDARHLYQRCQETACYHPATVARAQRDLIQDSGFL
eukprot:2000710-Rhodomonas_salina.3